MKNKRFIRVIAAIYVFSAMCNLFPSTLAETENLELYVSCDGSDSADGSKAFPFKTLERAKEEVRKYNSDMHGDIIVNIEPGVYYQTEGIDFLPEDSGSNGYNVIYRGIDKPVISGGIEVGGFTESDRGSGVYELYLPEFKEDGIYNMYNSEGGKRSLAKMNDWITPESDHAASDGNYTYDGIVFNKSDIPQLNKPQDSEVVWYRGWSVTKLHPQSVEYDSENTVIKFKNPEWNYYQLNKSSVVGAGSDISCYLQNDFSLLDEPGEFYYDKDSGKLYYIPMPFENMESETFIIPKLEAFAFFMGTKTAENEADSVKVKNITLEGIKFAHFNCDKSYDVYFESGQGPSYSGRSKATYSNDNGAIYLNRADNINFYNNDFTEMLQTPINLRNDVSNCNIEGNAFYGLSSSAIEIGATEQIERNFKEVDYTIKKLPKTDYNMMLLNPYISASDIFNADGSNNFSSLTILPKNTKTNANFYPDESFDHTSVQDLKNYKYYANNATWSDENGWIKYDFSRKYTFSEIALAFDPDVIPTENRAGFEVLLSNDEDFKEGNYVRVGESDGNYGEIVDFKTNITEKYRYLMIRSTDDKEFAVTNVYSFTSDLPHQIARRSCSNINISNNLIKNVCGDEFSNTAIFVYCCDDLNITHNEISDLPYTGISYGFCWGDYGLCGKGNISSNYIHNVNKILYDGGAVYTLGNHNGTTVEGNYIRNAAGGVGLYFDNGSYGITANNNVEEFSRATVTYNSGSKNCILNNTYTYTTSSNIEVSGESYNTVNEAVVYNLYDKNTEAEKIKVNAGLTDGFKNYPQVGVYNSTEYDLKMGLNSNCDIAEYRMPKFHKAVKTALENTAASENMPAPLKNEITAMLLKYEASNGKNAAALSGFAENIDKYFEHWSEGAVNYVKSDKITDFEIDGSEKTITLYSDSTDEFVPELVCGDEMINIGAVLVGGIYKLTLAEDERWTVYVKDSIEINVGDDEKISNIGKKPLTEVYFHYIGGIKALNESNFTFVRSDSGKPIKIKPYRVTDKLYAVDNSAFSIYSPNPDGSINTEKTEDYNIKISVNNAITDTENEINGRSYTRTVDRNTLPLKYTEGKIIKNIARGKLPDGVYDDVKESFQLTDEDSSTYNRYGYTGRKNQERDGYCFRIDLGGWYDIAAAVVEAEEKRGYGWDNNNSQYGFSADKTDFMSDTDIICSINSAGIKNGQRIGMIFDEDSRPRYRYFLGGPGAERDITKGTLLLGDVYVYAYVDERAVPAEKFDFKKYKIAYSENAVWGEAVTDGVEDVNIILAMYKNGTLLSAKSDGGGVNLRTEKIEVPGEWENFPQRNEVYEVKLFALSAFDKLVPYTEPKTNIIPQIACWGDSYTYLWPERLQELLGDKAQVYNLGISTNTAADIAGRQGGVPIALSEGVTLNNGEAVKLELKSSGDNERYALKLYDKLNEYSSSINPCTIDGITGTLSYSDGAYYFSDYETERNEISAGARIVTNQEVSHKNDIQIIMTGTNGGFGASTNEWAVLEQRMAANVGGDKKYLIMSLPSNTFNNAYVNSSNTYREKIFGERFLNLYKMLTDSECLAKYGIELTETDISEINGGSIPSSLLNEKKSFPNEKCFNLIAEMVYDKLKALGYTE